MEIESLRLDFQTPIIHINITEAQNISEQNISEKEEKKNKKIKTRREPEEPRPSRVAQVACRLGRT